MDMKKRAAEAALDSVKSGMVLGLGTGSTTSIFIELLGARLREGHLEKILAVPTSDATARLALKQGIPLTTLDRYNSLDLAVDGADEVDTSLNLIKGLGRALLREKIIVAHSNEFVVIVDESKLVNKLGSKGPLPVEIVKFEAKAHVTWLKSLGCESEQWLEDDGSPVETENGNYLVRCWFNKRDSEGITDPYLLAALLNAQPGIVEHGLFLDMAHRVIVGEKSGVRIYNRR